MLTLLYSASLVLKKTGLTCKVPAYIYNYQCSLECLNPLCTQLGHDGQKGWIYKVGDTTGSCKCYFCEIIFNPTASGVSSWVYSQKEHKILPFDFDEDSWNILYFGYEHHSIKQIHFLDIYPNWYVLFAKRYAYYLLQNQVFNVSGIRQRIGVLKQFGQIIQQYKIQSHTEISRRILLTFLTLVKTVNQ